MYCNIICMCRKCTHFNFNWHKSIKMQYKFQQIEQLISMKFTKTDTRYDTS